MMSSGVSLAWPISCRMTPRSRSSSSGSKTEWVRMSPMMSNTERGVFLQHLDVVGGLLARGVGVDMTADGLDLLGDFGGAAAGGALEGHVFEKVGDAILLRGFVARPGGDVGADRDGLDAIHAFGDDGKAGRQAGELDRFIHGRDFSSTMFSHAYGVAAGGATAEFLMRGNRSSRVASDRRRPRSAPAKSPAAGPTAARCLGRPPSDLGPMPGRRVAVSIGDH